MLWLPCSSLNAIHPKAPLRIDRSAAQNDCFWPHSPLHATLGHTNIGRHLLEDGPEQRPDQRVSQACHAKRQDERDGKNDDVAGGDHEPDITGA